MQTHKKFIAIFAMAALLSGSLVNTANAALTQASDTLSTSNLTSAATHTITFTTSVTLDVNDYMQVVLPAAFGDITTGDIVCPANTTNTAENTETARCTATSSLTGAAYTVTLNSIDNPAVAGVQDISIGTYAAGGALKESATVKVAILSGVEMKASVPSTLAFTVAPVATGTVVNTATTTRASATTSIDFGTLEAGTSTTMAQQLSVVTNATYGYSVTVQQSAALTNAAGATIDSYRDGAVPAAPETWNGPSGDLAATSTYGHMGFTTSDADLATDFTGGKWSGLEGADAVEVMSHDGPANGTEANTSRVNVAYRIEISGLQEAGDYNNILTYVATPTY